ncbi:O-methyltransferase ZRP4-like [Setaria italica]|uniref:O-methyltransferase ZRP4-like n=1 Tax=Setaria italica TaxID=4555 RepID=UPI0006466F1C|nr:O-methyltransferase ZRP4-like [Setaria italica]
MAITTSTNKALLDAQVELWHTTFAYIKSMALKSALDLGIADAIHGNDGTATLPQIVSRVTLHSSKIPCPAPPHAGTHSHRHLLQRPTPGRQWQQRAHVLTPASQLLVGTPSLTPFMALVLDGIYVSPFLGLGTW